MEFCDNIIQLLQGYFRDFSVERLEKPWKAFTASWSRSIIARNLGNKIPKNFCKKFTAPRITKTPYTKVIPKLVFTLSRWTCNAIYWNLDKARVFCSSLSFQQALVGVRTSNRSRVTAGFMKTVAHTPLENEVQEEVDKKMGGTRSKFGSMGNVRRKVSASFIIKKIFG